MANGHVCCAMYDKFQRTSHGKEAAVSFPAGGFAGEEVLGMSSPPMKVNTSVIHGTSPWEM